MIKTLRSKSLIKVAKQLKLPLLLLLIIGFNERLLAQATFFVLGNESQISAVSSDFTSLVTQTINGVTVPYLAYTESGVAKVKRYINGSWEQVGGNVATGAGYLNLAVDKNGKVYLSMMYTYTVDGTTYTDRLGVKTFNATTQAWGDLGGIKSVSSGPISTGQTAERVPYNNAIAFDSNNVPYVAYGEFASGASGVGNAWLKYFSNNTWNTVGTGAINLTDRANSIDIDFTSADIPYVVYHDGTSSGQIKSFRFVNNVWENLSVPVTVGTLPASAARTTRLAINKSTNKIYVNFSQAGSGTTANAITYADGTWSTLGGRIGSGSAASYTSTMLDASGNLYALFRDQMTSTNGTYKARLHAVAANTSSWTEIGATGGFDGPVNSYTSVAYGSDNGVYIAYLKTNSNAKSTPVVQVYKQENSTPADIPTANPRQMEKLSRGLVALRKSTSEVYIGWRLFGTDPSEIAFNIYRDGLKLNSSPITTSTNYIDNTSSSGSYTIKPVLNGVEQTATPPVSVWDQFYKTIPLQIPAGGTTPSGEAYTYSPNDCNVGDLDGDGDYEIVVKWDPSNSKDNSQGGYTGNVYLDAYKLNGTRLWRIDLGKNIRAGAHYTQLMVYDLDGDGKAEIACKTADGTIDGVGIVIGDANADYRNSSGYILSGPEFFTVFNGLTGAALATDNFYPGRGTVSAWGDDYGNRVDRFISAIAYVDGEKPSVIMGRGYYTRLVRTAWDWRNGKLTRKWVFDSNSLGNADYYGQGNHQLIVADVDGDGKDEVINGSSVINDNGTGLWTDKKGHGDAMHISDLDPSTPGLEMWMNHEDQSSYGTNGLTMRNAKTGASLWGVPSTGDIGRSMAADIDPRYPGYEVWGSAGGNVYTNKGVAISNSVPSYNFGIWWDGDLSREILDGTKLDKWYTTGNSGAGSASRLLTIYNYANADDINGTKANPCLTADILGDWREEMVFKSSDNANLIVFTTPHLTDKRIYTLMHDPQYRLGVASENSAYNQPPNPGFFLGTDMAAPPVPNITLVNNSTLPVSVIDFKAKASANKVTLNWSTASEVNNKYFTIERSANGKEFVSVIKVNGSGDSNVIHNYSAVDYEPFYGTSYYRLRQTDADGKSTVSGTQKVTVLKAETGLTINPNPVSTEVKLNLNSGSRVIRFSLLALDGKQVMHTSGNIDQVNGILNGSVNSLRSGVYVVQIQDEGKTFSQKLIRK